MTILSEIPSTVGFRSISFDIGRKQQLTPSGGGAIQTIERALPMWAASYATPPLVGVKQQDMIAFLDEREGAINPFLAYDPRRIMPAAYASLSLAADPWTQTGQTAPRITATNFTNSTVTLDRLQNGAILTKGDYISFNDGIAWWLYRLQENKVVSGNTVTVKVGPRPSSIAASYNIRYRKACCAMKIIGGYDAPTDVNTPTVISFKAFQYIEKA